MLRKPPEPLDGENKIETQNKKEGGEFVERGAEICGYKEKIPLFIHIYENSIKV